MLTKSVSRPGTLSISDHSKKVFQLDESQDVEGLQVDNKPCKRCRRKPKLWQLIIGIFLVVFVVSFGLSTTLLYNNSYAGLRQASTASDHSLERFAELAETSIDELVGKLDIQDMNTWKLAAYEYISLPFLAVEMLYGAMQPDQQLVSMDDVDANARYLWGLQTRLPKLTRKYAWSGRPKLEDIYYADVTGTYLAYTNLCVNGYLTDCPADSSWVYGFEYLPSDDLNASATACKRMCPSPYNFKPNYTYFYKVDFATGRFDIELANDVYDPRSRPWWNAAVDAKLDQRSVWVDVYVLTGLRHRHLSETKSDLGISVNRAMFVGGQPQMIAGATITLKHLTTLLQSKMQEPEYSGLVFVVDTLTGKMIASSNGFDDVICNNSSCTDDQLMWEETGDALIITAMGKLVETYGGLDLFELEGPPLHMALDLHHVGTSESEAQGTKYILSHACVCSGTDASQLKWIIVHAWPMHAYNGLIEVALLSQKHDSEAASLALCQRIGQSRNKIFILCVFLGVVGVVALGFVACLVTRPLKRIAYDMHSVARLGLEGDSNALSSFSDGKHDNVLISEIAEIRSSFEAMRNGLCSFSKYIDPHLAQVMVASHRVAELSVARANVTIFFSDIAGFTTIAEILEPTTLMRLLGQYFEEMSNIISERKGVVGEYIGDGIMAWWNVPWDLGNRHTAIALAATLEQQKRLSELRNQWCQDGLPEIRARMGLVRGDVLAGNVGSSTRMKYGLVGDSVNLASRLENLCERYGVQILIDDTSSMSEGVDEEFYIRPVDLVVVKGRSQTTELFELIGRKSEVQEPSMRQMYDKFCIDFAMIHRLYRNRDFWGALDMLRSYRIFWPDDHPAEIMVRRC